jgi:putative endonuclease
MSGRLTHSVVKALDRAALLLGRVPKRAAHLRTGTSGEELAYFHLRTIGYTIVARNFRSPRRKGEIDLIGWNDGVLCFIEVKTRSTPQLAPAEVAVDQEKRRELRYVAREYLRRVHSKDGEPAYRFDVVSVYLHASPPRFELTKAAFGIR